MKVKIDHINLTVANFKESIEWYGRVFGFTLVESGVTPKGIRWGIISNDDSMICMTEYPNWSMADTLESKATHRMYHFGIRVSDQDRWRQTVIEHSLKLYYGGEVEYPFSRSWYVHDPSGHGIEVSFSAGKPLQFPAELVEG